MSEQSTKPSQTSEDKINPGTMYFDDGDIILLSSPDKKSGTITAFKVDTAYLKRSSEVFANMINDAGKEKNVPLGDTPEHLALFLRALYDTSTLLSTSHKTSTLSMVEVILDMADKYHVENLRRCIIYVLQRDWPNDLLLWDCRESNILRSSQGFSDADQDDPIPDPCRIIRLVHQHDIPDILPTAFYDLAGIDPIIDRALYKGDHVYHCVNADPKSRRRVDFSLLSHEDILRLSMGIRKMSEDFRKICKEILLQMFTDQGNECQSGCTRGLEALAERLELIVRTEHNPLKVMNDAATNAYGRSDICSHCVTYFARELKSRRQAFWEDIPSYFHLAKAQEAVESDSGREPSGPGSETP